MESRILVLRNIRLKSFSLKLLWITAMSMPKGYQMFLKCRILNNNSKLRLLDVSGSVRDPI
jgi:hypothetical protein